jgi:hypothetical protein
MKLEAKSNKKIIAGTVVPVWRGVNYRLLDVDGVGMRARY